MHLDKLLAGVDFFKWKFGGLALGSWMAFAIISVAAFIALRWLQRILTKRLGLLTARTKTKLDDLVVELIRRTNPFVILLLSLYAGSFALTLPGRVLTLMQAVVAVAFLWQIGLWGGRIISYFLDRLALEKVAEDAGLVTAIGALNFVARLAMWSILVLMILSSFHIDVTSVIAGLGVGGVAVALAVQNILGDLFASLSIVFDKPFAVGHFIVVDDILGTVEHVGLKTTRLRSLSGEQVVVANSDLLRSRIHNYKLLRERRVLFGFGVLYSTPYEKLSAIPSMVGEIVGQVPRTRFDRAHFKEYGDSSLNFEVVYYVLDPDYNVYMDTQQAINLALFKRFEAEGIEFAFPTRTLYINPASAVPRTDPPS